VEGCVCAARTNRWHWHCCRLAKTSFEPSRDTGATTLHFAKALRAQGIGGKIVAVDTWLGALEFWDKRLLGANDTTRDLGLVNGFPSVYYTFLSNVVILRVQAQVIPLPVPSQLAARLLREKQASAEIIHLDGSHEYEDVLHDLRQWWPLVRPGGVLFGDDYKPFWPGVVRAVDEFVAARGLTLTVDAGKWLVRKPLAAATGALDSVGASCMAEATKRLRTAVPHAWPLRELHAQQPRRAGGPRGGGVRAGQQTGQSNEGAPTCCSANRQLAALLVVTVAGSTPAERKLIEANGRALAVSLSAARLPRAAPLHYHVIAHDNHASRWAATEAAAREAGFRLTVTDSGLPARVFQPKFALLAAARPFLRAWVARISRDATRDAAVWMLDADADLTSFDAKRYFRRWSCAFPGVLHLHHTHSHFKYPSVAYAHSQVGHRW